MQTRSWKLIGVLALLMAFSLIIAGCDSATDFDGDAHGVRVSLNVPEDGFLEVSGDVGILTIESKIDVTRVVVELFDDGDDLVETKELDDPADIMGADYKYEVTFTDVDSGEDYYVKAEIHGEVRDEDEKVRYKGESEEFPVLPDEIVEVEVDVDPLSWESLEVQLFEAEDNDGILDRVKGLELKHPSKETEAYLDWNKDPGDTVTFDEGHDDLVKEDMLPARWHFAIQFDDTVGEVDYVDRDDEWIEILLLPNEDKELELTISEIGGKVIVEINVFRSPDTPENLRVDEGYLKWDPVDDADHYQVLMDESGYEGYFKPVETIDVGEIDAEDPKFLLFGQEPGNYYVRAYEDGYSSDVQEEAVTVELDDTEGVYNETQSTFHDTIQDAIDSASNNPGDIILLAGEFEEHILIDRGLTLKAVVEHGAKISYHEDAGDESSEKTIRVEADNVTIKDLVLSRTRDEDNGVAQAIRVNGSNVEINNNIIHGNVGYGISVQAENDGSKTDDVTITENKIKGEFTASIGVIAMLGTLDAGVTNEIGTVTIADNELLNYTREGLQVSKFGDHGGSIDEITVTSNTFNSEAVSWHIYEVIFDGTPVLDWKNIIEGNNFIQDVVLFETEDYNLVYNKNLVNVVNTDQNTGFFDIQAAIDDAEEGETIKLNRDIEYTAPNEDANFVIPQDNLVLDGNDYSLKYAEIGGGRSVIEATGDGVIVRNLTLKNQSPDKQPFDLNAIGKNVLFKYNEIRRGTEQGNPAIIIGPDATGSIVRDNTIDYGAIAADTHDCIIADNTMEWVISEGIWMHPTPYTAEEAKDRANDLAEDNTINDYDAEGPVKVLDKDGGWQFADND